MAIFTTTWPSVIIKGVYVKNSNKVFYYKDIQFTLFQNLEMGTHDIFVIEVTLYYIKRGLGQKKS